MRVSSIPRIISFIKERQLKPLSRALSRVPRPTKKQIPFNFRITNPEQKRILKSLHYDSVQGAPYNQSKIEAQKNALASNLLNIDFDENTQRVIFKYQETGKSVKDKKYFTHDKYGNIERNIHDTPEQLAIPHRPLQTLWDGKKPLRLTIDQTPNHLNAGTITAYSPEGKKLTLPLDGIGMPKPLGFVPDATRGMGVVSFEGGPAEGPKCQKASFIRRVHIALAHAMGVDKGDIKSLLHEYKKIMSKFHDRVEDVNADEAIIDGHVSDEWGYGYKILAPRKQDCRLVGEYIRRKRLPKSYFHEATKKLRNNQESMDVYKEAITNENKKPDSDTVFQEEGKKLKEQSSIGNAQGRDIGHNKKNTSNSKIAAKWADGQKAFTSAKDLFTALVLSQVIILPMMAISRPQWVRKIGNSIKSIGVKGVDFRPSKSEEIMKTLPEYIKPAATLLQPLIKYALTRN